MSEPDYEIGLEQERISSLEGLQEDTFFNTENFFYMLGDLDCRRPHGLSGPHHPRRLSHARW